MSELNDLERAVLKKLFDGEHPVLAALRQQLKVATVASSEMTGAGFFTTFTLPSGVMSAPIKKARLGDVEAKIPGLDRGAGFLVYVDSGRLHMLEGYSYEEPWPDPLQRFEIRYTDEARPAIMRAFK